MNKLKIIFIIYLLLASFSALAEEDVYYCNMTEGQFISSEEEENTKEKLDFAFFLKVDEDKKTMEFSENFVTNKFLSSEVSGMIEGTPFFDFPLEIQEVATASDELLDKLNLTSSEKKTFINDIKEEFEFSIFAQDSFMRMTTLHLKKDSGKLGISINLSEFFVVLFAHCTGFKN